MAVFTKTNKSSTPVWGKSTQHTAVWTKVSHSLGNNSFLLLENGFYLLLEDGSSKLILEQSNPSSPTFTHMLKEVG